MSKIEMWKWFKLPVDCELIPIDCTGDGDSVSFSGAKLLTAHHVEKVEIAINSYDANQALITKQAEQIKILITALEAVAKVNHTHGGSLGFSGHFYYKVSENVFKLCDKALEATKPVEE